MKTYPNSDGGNQGDAIRINASFAGSKLSARSQLVCVVVEHSITDTTDRRHGKTCGNAGDGAIMDIHAAQHGVETIVEDWSKDDDTQRVEIADNVVGHTIGGQHG